MNSKQNFIRDRRQQKKYAAERRDLFLEQHGIKYDTYRYWCGKSGTTNPKDVIAYMNQHKGESARNSRESNDCPYKKYQANWNHKKDNEFMELYGFKYTAYKSYKNTHNNASIEDYAEYKRFKALSQIEKENNYNYYLKHKRAYNRVKQPKKVGSQTTMNSKKQAYFELQTKINNLERLITNPEIREPRISKLRAEFEEIYGEIII